MSYLEAHQRDLDNPKTPTPGEVRAELRREFLNVWETWERASSRTAGKDVKTGALTLEQQASALEKAAGGYAATLGMRTTPFRDLLASLRRAGYGRANSLRAVELVVGELGNP